MGKQKTGDLRVLKNGAVYGPMTRAELEMRLAHGKFAAEDQVSFQGAAWIAIAEYLAFPPLDGQSAPERCLRVLKGKTMFPPLSRAEVVELAAQGRVGEDDLICALDGPWMRLGDFFAPPAVSRPAENDPRPLPARAIPVGRLRVADLLEEQELPDEWYAKVRGLHSSPMQKRHIRLLYQSGELTLESIVRNACWREDDWRPISSVPEVYAAATRI